MPRRSNTKACFGPPPRQVEASDKKKKTMTLPERPPHPTLPKLRSYRKHLSEEEQAEQDAEDAEANCALVIDHCSCNISSQAGKEALQSGEL